MSFLITKQTLAEADLPKFVINLDLLGKIPVTIGLVGNLGAGKTTLVKSIAAELEIDPAIVCSPSYNLMNEYLGAKFQIEHWDLYRLTTLPEELNFQPESNVLRIVEWSNLIDNPNGIINYQINIEIVDQLSRSYSFQKF